jgi:Domain of unknown function (DUF4190)
MSGESSSDQADWESQQGQQPWTQPESPAPGTPSGPAPWPQSAPGGFTAPSADPWPASQQPGATAAPADPWAQPQQFQQPGSYPPGPGQFRGYQPPYFGPAPRNNPFAITALICGIGQFVLGLLVFGNIVLAIPAIVFGALSLKQIRLRGERGRGMAIAGLVLGILGVIYFALVVIIIATSLHVSHGAG